MSQNFVFKKKLRLCLKLVILSLVISCNGKRTPKKQVIDKSTQMQMIIDAKLETPEEICFQDVKKLVFEDSCLDCHDSSNPQGGVDLSDYHAVIDDDWSLVHPTEPDDSVLYQTLLDQTGERTMPPSRQGASITEGQKMLVYQWIKHGAKNTPYDEIDVTQSLAYQLQPYFDAPETIDYEVIQKYVFEPGMCLKCHSQNSPEAEPMAYTFGADLTNYNSLFYRNGIVPGRLYNYHDTSVVTANGDFVERDGSKIYQVIEDQSMPPVDKGYQPMNPQRLRLLRLWIENCAVRDSHDELPQAACI